MVAKREDAMFLTDRARAHNPRVSDTPERRALARRRNVDSLSDEQVSRLFRALSPAEQTRLAAPAAPETPTPAAEAESSEAAEPKGRSRKGK